MILLKGRLAPVGAYHLGLRGLIALAASRGCRFGWDWLAAEVALIGAGLASPLYALHAGSGHMAKRAPAARRARGAGEAGRPSSEK